jgi:glycosyltransferase involved in cell wall biosynthesis
VRNRDAVQRTVKFVKYLPHFGWKPTVLTVANPSVPVLDKSLEADIPADTEIRRARTYEPGYALKAAVSGSGTGKKAGGLKVAVKSVVRRLANLGLQPDAQVLWIPGAVKEGLKILREQKHDAIMVSGPPFSSFLAAATLAKKTGLPLVLDYRDEWGISNSYLENKQIGRVSNAIQGRMQRNVVRRARALIATTKPSAAELTRVRDRAGAKAEVVCIYNGFDPDDFQGHAAEPTPVAEVGRYRLAYVGTLWNLTDVSPLVEAVIDLARRRPELVERLDLAFAGRRTADQESQLQRLAGTGCRLVLYPYLDHARAVSLARSADSLCVLLADVPEAGRVVPAKVFESMAARVPILVIAPRGEVWDLLEGHPAAGLFEPKNVALIAEFLASAIEGKGRGLAPEFGAYDSSPYERRVLAGRLAELLDRIVT